MLRPFCTPGYYKMSIDEFRNSNLYCQSHWHQNNNRFALTHTVNLTKHETRESNDHEWINERSALKEQHRLSNPQQLSSSKLPDLLQKKNASALPKVGVDADTNPATARQKEFMTSLRSGPSSSSSSSSGPFSSITPFSGTYTSTPIGLGHSSSSSAAVSFTPLRPILPLGTPHVGFTSFPSSPPARACTPGSVNKVTSYSSSSMSSVMLTSELPKLTDLSTDCLTRFLENCQQKNITGEQIINQIDEQMKFLIGLKLSHTPMPNYSASDNSNWQTEIPITELLQYIKTTVTHGQLSSDAIVQAALKKIKFEIDLEDVGSIDRIAVNINNILVRDLPADIKSNIDLQKVMMKGLMSTLNKSSPKPFCQDLFNFITGKGREIHDVASFNMIFNQEACAIIKNMQQVKRYLSKDSSKADSSNPYKK